MEFQLRVSLSKALPFSQTAHTHLSAPVECKPLVLSLCYYYIKLWTEAALDDCSAIQTSSAGLGKTIVIILIFFISFFWKATSVLTARHKPDL